MPRRISVLEFCAQAPALLTLLTPTGCASATDVDSLESTPSTANVLARHEVAVRERSKKITTLYPAAEHLAFANWADDGWNPDVREGGRGYWVYVVKVTAQRQGAISLY